MINLVVKLVLVRQIQEALVLGDENVSPTGKSRRVNVTVMLIPARKLDRGVEICNDLVKALQNLLPYLLKGAAATHGTLSSQVIHRFVDYVMRRVQLEDSPRPR